MKLLLAIPFALLLSRNLKVLVFMERLIKLFVMPRGKEEKNTVCKSCNQTTIESILVILSFSSRCENKRGEKNKLGNE